MNIVAFTFTDKAAAESKERIVTRTEGAPEVGALGSGHILDRPREAGRIRHLGPTKKGGWEVLEDDEW